VKAGYVEGNGKTHGVHRSTTRNLGGTGVTFASLVLLMLKSHAKLDVQDTAGKRGVNLGGRFCQRMGAREGVAV